MTLLASARAGDHRAFDELVGPHRRELLVHCYRMLGSIQDAEDALQETLLAAWRGLAGFEQRSSLRSWLYRIATNCCLRLTRNRPARVLSFDHAPPLTATHDLGAAEPAELFVEPWPDSSSGGTGNPEDAVASKEEVELAFIAALQLLPPNQRAVLILRDVLAFSSAEVADLLGTSTPSVNSALQRARSTVGAASVDRYARRLPGDEEQALVAALVAAWERADVDSVISLLARDVRFTMPPLPAWFDGRASVERFLRERVFQTPWRFVRTRANGRPAIGGYQGVAGRYALGSLTLLHVGPDGIEWFASFLDPAVLDHLGLPPVLDPVAG
ncbi:RNA polymerase subunit sigma-70 [Intrasporangium sp. DVR]|uniref:RNA polymerase subunit sigma-70 n=1 Tax=Intrasporangium sp. DVR TaxID=3127867 RepID=UPI00313A65D9